MESEKVKEIKKIANLCIRRGGRYCNSCAHEKETDAMLTCRPFMKELIILINELEKENKNKTDTITDLLNKQEFYEKEQLKQFVERLKEKVKDYEALTYKNNEVTYHNLELDIDETLKEFLNENN